MPRFADDTVVITENEQDLRDIVTKVDEIFTKDYNLKPNNLIETKLK